LPVIVVGGSNKSVGKTSLVCGIIAAFPEVRWTAVKITSHDYGQAESVWEEPPLNGISGEEPKTDTARYLAAGAYRALLVKASKESLPWSEMEPALEGQRYVIYESTRAAGQIHPDIRLALVSGAEAEFKPSFAPFLGAADAVVALPGAEIVLPKDEAPIPVFRLAHPNGISRELIEWLHERFEALPPSVSA
jgi:hypothetical protein